MSDFTALKELNDALERGGPSHVELSVLIVRDLDVTMKVVTYAWGVGSMPHVRYGQRSGPAIIVRVERRPLGMWYRVRFNDGAVQWVPGRTLGINWRKT